MSPHSRKRGPRKQYKNKQDDQSEQTVPLPKKKLYRQRAHANPFSDHQLEYPLSPDHMDWAAHFPAFVDPDPSNVNLAGTRRLVKDVEVVDIGCGFGGLLVALAPLMPNTLMIGMEIRVQVLEYVRARIQALRAHKPVPQAPESANTPDQKKNISSAAQTKSPSTTEQATSSSSSPSTLTTTTAAAGAPPATTDSPYQNISGIRANTMKFVPNFFGRHQLHSIYICFPDPHFKARKHKARIVSETLNAEYAFVLRPGGKVYTITDVEELHRWMVGHFESGAGDDEGGGDGGKGEGAQGETGVKSLWERVGEDELASDPCVKIMMDETEEGKKVTRNNGKKFVAVWRRRADPAWPEPSPSPCP